MRRSATLDSARHCSGFGPGAKWGKGQTVLHRLHLGRAALLGALVLLAAPSAALADGTPAFNIGPLKVKNGYSMSIFGFSCGTKYAGGSITFTKTGTGFSESHTYSGTKHGSCSLAKNLSSGSLKFSIGKSATINITFSKRGSKKTGPLPPGCTGTHPTLQGGIAKGTIKVNISSFFGRVNKSQLKASVQSEPKFTCGPTKSFKKTYFLSVSGGSTEGGMGLNASLPPSGSATLSFYDSQSSTSMFASHTLTLIGSRSMFTPKSDLSSAKVKGSGKVSGTLTFTADASCQSTTARTGSLSGSLTAHFDVGGNLTIKQTTPAPYAVLSRDETGQPCH